MNAVAVPERQDWVLRSGFLYLGLLIGLNVAFYVSEQFKTRQIPIVKFKYIKVREKVLVSVPVQVPAPTAVPDSMPIKRNTASLPEAKPAEEKIPLPSEMPPPRLPPPDFPAPKRQLRAAAAQASPVEQPEQPKSVSIAEEQPKSALPPAARILKPPSIKSIVTEE